MLTRGAPYLPVSDLPASIEHYERVFGFTSEYVGGRPPEFAIVSRDGQALMLRVVPEPGRIVPNEAQGGTWDVFYWVEGLGTLHAELAAAGAEIVYGPIVQEHYGMREFAVRDPDGHVLGFGEPVSG